MTFMRPTDPSLQTYYHNTTTALSLLLQVLLLVSYAIHTSHQVAKGSQFVNFVRIFTKSLFASKMKCNQSLLSDLGLILCCQIAVNRSYICYDIKMGKSINFKPVWGIWGLGFGVCCEKKKNP